MKVYFLKENICEYVIFPAPDDLPLLVIFKAIEKL